MLARHRRQGRTYWTLPGGGVEEGETLTEALQREWIEETGITIAEEHPLRFLLDVVTPLGHGRSRHIVNLIFEVQQQLDCPVVEPHLVPGEHLDQVDWVTLEEFPTLPFLPPVQSEIIRIAGGWNPQEILYLNNRWIDVNAIKEIN